MVEQSGAALGVGMKIVFFQRMTFIKGKNVNTFHWWTFSFMQSC